MAVAEEVSSTWETERVTVSPMDSRPSITSHTTSMPASVLPVVWLALK